MKTIPLTQGKVALVDDADFEALSRYRWRANKTYKQWRALRHSSVAERSRGFPDSIMMHRQIMGFPSEGIDHRDRDSLNNQRANLRLATHQQQMANSRTRPHGHFRGVRPHWHRFVARIRYCREQYHLGSFATAVEAARAYDDAARRLFGQFAVVNFP